MDISSRSIGVVDDINKAKVDLPWMACFELKKDSIPYFAWDTYYYAASTVHPSSVSDKVISIS